MSKHEFKTEVNQLLELIIHSLYSHKEIFLRELVSNASDALDKLRYLTLTDDSFKNITFQPQIDISFDLEAKTLTVADNGVGMNEEDLIENLGTIANSGTRKFLSQIKPGTNIDTNLIGQFGVGFYSIYMVAERAEVLTKRAGEDKAFLWKSDGKGSFEIEPGSRLSHGTTVTLYLNEEGQEFANRFEIESIVKKYSNHIPYPIILHYDEEKEKGKKEKKTLQLNSASALWKRPKSELKESDYFEFYHNLTHDPDDPLLYIHTHAEGALQYSTLFFIPKKAPFDLFYLDYRPGIKLYVKRVFITDNDKELLPTYLRFVRGIIDSDDLPLNVSREILQKNKVIANIRAASVKKILSELINLSLDKEKYLLFYNEFRKCLKEGLYQDLANRDTLLELLRFKSTKVEGYTSLSDYKLRLKPGQKAIYYLCGPNESSLRSSALLEAYQQKDYEVLLLDDEIDELVMPAIGKYKDLEFKAINRSDAAEELKTDADRKSEKEVQPLLKRMTEALKDVVKEVKAGAILKDSPVCLILDANDLSPAMQQMLKAMGQKDLPDQKPILQINPQHEVIKKLTSLADEQVFKDSCMLLYGQALLNEGVELKNPADFSHSLNRILVKAL